MRNWCRIIGCVYVVLVFSGSLAAQEEESAEEATEESHGRKTAAGQIVMNVIEIKGKIERPQAVYIINLAKPEFQGITLEKDFVENVKDEDFGGMENFSVDESLPPKL